MVIPHHKRGSGQMEIPHHKRGSGQMVIPHHKRGSGQMVIPHHKRGSGQMVIPHHKRGSGQMVIPHHKRGSGQMVIPHHKRGQRSKCVLPIQVTMFTQHTSLPLSREVWLTDSRKQLTGSNRHSKQWYLGCWDYTLYIHRQFIVRYPLLMMKDGQAIGVNLQHNSTTSDHLCDNVK